MPNNPRRSKKALNTVNGQVLQFLRRNYFFVQLPDRCIAACMPEKLLPSAEEFRSGQWRPRVKVLVRPHPRMARIVGYASPIVGFRS